MAPVAALDIYQNDLGIVVSGQGVVALDPQVMTEACMTELFQFLRQEGF